MTSGLQDRPDLGGGVPSQLVDLDPVETGEWVASLDGAVDQGGRARARYLMLRLLQRARERQVAVPDQYRTDYLNTIPPELEPPFPGDERIERRIRAYIRWNAAIMVHRAQRPENMQVSTSDRRTAIRHSPTGGAPELLQIGAHRDQRLLWLAIIAGMRSILRPGKYARHRRFDQGVELRGLGCKHYS